MSAPEQAGVGVQQLAKVAQAARAREVALRKCLAGEGDAVRLVVVLPQPVDDLRVGRSALSIGCCLRQSRVASSLLLRPGQACALLLQLDA